jgi:acyl carrier protein
MRPLPPNVPGELHIGGIQVARGYLNRPDLTAERFVSDPFDGQEGARLYKTGDICRFLDDGNIEYLGRNDFQIKLRGRRIEAGEIEAVLGQHPAVQQSLVMVREDTPEDKILVAYVVPSTGVPISDSILRSFLKSRLPDIMVPAAFVMMDAFPLTLSGKTDRRALPPPHGLRPELDSAYVPARRDVERTIASIWQSVLGLDTAGLNDNFFDLGGDSLRMIRVHGKLQETLGREVPLLELFKYPTILSLARNLISDGGDEQAEIAGNFVDRTGIRAAGKERLRRRADRNSRGNAE